MVTEYQEKADKNPPFLFISSPNKKIPLVFSKGIFAINWALHQLSQQILDVALFGNNALDLVD